jgi:hypothetical protein
MSDFNSLPARTLRRLYLNLFLRGRSSRGLSRGFGSRKASTTVAGKLSTVLVFYALIGLVAVAAVQHNVFLTSFFLHTMGMAFTGMFIAASAGEVLFNKDEDDILGHRPIDSRQLLWAKVFVLLQVSMLMALSYSLPGCLRVTFGSPSGFLFLIAHVISTALSIVFGTGLVVLLYQLCLRWFGRERLDNLMTVAQVLLTIGFIGGSQLLRPLMMGNTILSNLEGAWWIFFVPPAWFAGVDTLLTGNGDAGSVVLTLLALTATGTVAAFAFGKLADSTQNEILAASETSVRPGISYTRRTWIDRLTGVPPLSLALRHPVVRASFRLCVAYMLRDRDTKLRLYPGIASVFVMPLLFAFGSIGGKDGFGIAFSGAYIGLIPLMSVNLLQFSQDWLAADIFRLGPAGGPGHFIRGGLLAIFVVLVIPACLFMFVVAFFAHNNYSHPLLLLLPGLIALPAYTFLAGATTRSVPFSRPTEESKSAGRGIKMTGIMLSAMALGGGSFFAAGGGYLTVFLVIEAIVCLVICLAANASISRIAWDPVE